MIVSNTSTLILLAKSTLLESWIRDVRITIPEEVNDEAVLGKESYDARLIKKYIEEGKIAIQKASGQKTEFAIHEFRLDVGEAAAYSLFDPKKHRAIMTDDAELIKLCKLEGIEFVGAMGIAVALHRKGVLSRAEALEKIEKLYQIGRYSKDIYSYFKTAIEGGN